MGQATTADPAPAHGARPQGPLVRRLVVVRRLAAAAQRVPPAAQGLIALAGYLAVWIGTEAYPLLRYPGTPQLAQGGFDPNFYVWALHWWPYALGHGLNPLRSAQIGAPAGYSLAWVTTVPPLALLLAPVTLTAGPVAAFSLLVVAGVPVSGWGAFALCRRLTGKFWASLAGGAVFAFSAFEINHAYTGQLNLDVSVLLPLIAYLMVAWRDGAVGPRAFVTWTVLALTVQAYLFLETFAELTAVLVAGFAVGAAVAGRDGRPRVARLALLTGISYVISLAATVPLVGYALAHRPAAFTRETVTTSIPLNGLWVPLAGHDLDLRWLANAAGRLLGVPGRDGYLGIPLLVLMLALPLVARASRLARFLLALTILVILGAFGPVLRVDNATPLFHLPWSRLWSLPIATSAYPSRLMVFAFLAASVAVALWLALPGRWQAASSWARWLLAALALAALAGNVNRLDYGDQSGTPAFIATGAYRAYVPPGATVVVLSQRGNAGLLWQAETNGYFRLSGGFVNAALTPNGGVPGPVAQLMPPPGSAPGAAAEAAFRQYLRDSQVADILVEDGQHSGRWPSVLRQAGFTGTTIGGVIVYRSLPLGFPAKQRTVLPNGEGRRGPAARCLSRSGTPTRVRRAAPHIGGTGSPPGDIELVSCAQQNGR